MLCSVKCGWKHFDEDRGHASTRFKHSMDWSSGRIDLLEQAENQGLGVVVFLVSST